MSADGTPVTRAFTDTERAEHQARVHSGLKDARAALAELWRLHCEPGNESQRDLVRRALEAVIEAEATLRAADAFVAAPTRANREALHRRCSLRVGRRP